MSDLTPSQVTKAAAEIEYQLAESSEVEQILIDHTLWFDRNACACGAQPETPEWNVRLPAWHARHVAVLLPKSPGMAPTGSSISYVQLLDSEGRIAAVFRPDNIQWQSNSGRLGIQVDGYLTP